MKSVKGYISFHINQHIFNIYLFYIEKIKIEDVLINQNNFCSNIMHMTLRCGDNLRKMKKVSVKANKERVKKDKNVPLSLRARFFL